MTTHASCLVVPRTSSASEIVVNSEHRRKSVRFSRFEKVYYTHSPIDYDRTSILAELALAKHHQIQQHLNNHHSHPHHHHIHHHHLPTAEQPLVTFTRHAILS